MTHVALTIAGSDPSGGAGLQADLKTFQRHGVFGAGVVTLLTVQNTVGVQAVESLSPAFVTAQLEAVLNDIPPHAAKTGALGSAAVIEAVARQVAALACPLVVDPVMISKHGAALIDEAAVRTLIDRLLPHALLTTPNVFEAERLTGVRIDSRAALERAAAAIAAMGPKHVLIKGGSRLGDAADLLYSSVAADASAPAAPHVACFPGRRIDTAQTHGSGCVFSAAITALLARGTPLHEAVAMAKQYITQAIATAPNLGHGHGPVNIGA